MKAFRAFPWNCLHFTREAVLHELSGRNGEMVALFWGVLVVAAAVTYLRSDAPRSLPGLTRYLFPKGTFGHASARADLLFWLSRRIWVPMLVLPLVVSTAVAGQFAHALLVGLVGAPMHPPGHAGPWTLILFTITMFLAYDISYYFYHVLQHRVTFMWELHKVHHSAERMVGVTKDRVHPLDEIMNSWWDGLIPGFAYGVWSFYALNPVELTIFGLNVYFIRNTLLMMDFVRHTHFKLSYGKWLDYIFLSPHYHQLHHSVAKEHWDKNFGLSLAIWDRMFGTLVVPSPGEDFMFGLQNREADEYQSLLRLHLVPLKRLFLLARGRCRQMRPGSATTLFRSRLPPSRQSPANMQHRP